MRPANLATVSALFGAAIGYVAVSALHPRSSMRYPDTRRDDIVEDHFGTKVADPYRWLEDASRPEVKDWIRAENETTRAALDALPGRDALVARLRELFYYDAVGAPLERGGRSFWSRKHADQEKTIVYWKEGGDEHVLLDPNQWSADGSTALGGWWPSWDGRVVAYNVNPNNADEAEMHFLDVASGRELPDVIAGTKYSGASWSPDSRGFYYTWVPPIGGDVTIPNRPGYAELRYHTLGTPPEDDPVVRDATHDPETFLGGGISKDGRWLLVAIQHGWVSTDWYFRDLQKGDTAWRPLVVGVKANYSVIAWGDRFYVLTDDGAPRYRILAIDPDTLARTELVPESEATIDGMNLVGGKLVVTYLRRATSAMEIRDLDGTHPRAIDLPPMGTTGGIAGEPDEDTGYFAFTSFTEPQVIYQVSIATGAVREWTRVKLPIDSARFVTEQVTYTSKDGTPISMFVIHRADVRADGSNPTVLYGYGGFNVNMTPGFASSRMVWLEHGGVWAIPNLRGGGEYGEDWHRDGMLANKQNVFDDYLAAAQWLIDHRWTSPAHLAIYGGSNGGLLVGAAMTQAPSRFKAVVCGVPLLDMVRFHEFGSGATWIPEYGDPREEDAFKWLYAYSPYHHVVDGTSYPALLMLSADSDDRVDPMHARKFVAAIQHANPDGAPAYLRIEQHGGHGGADLVKQQVDLYADMYLFLLDQLR